MSVPCIFVSFIFMYIYIKLFLILITFKMIDFHPLYDSNRAMVIIFNETFSVYITHSSHL